jgi:hypothetical protein
MPRLRIGTVPEISVLDEAAVFKSASNSNIALIEFKDSSGNVVGNIQSNGLMNISSIIATNPGNAANSFATRSYVDSFTAGLNWHEIVNFATVAALPACTYSNGTNGVGATLTGSANGRLTVDGSPVSDRRIDFGKKSINPISKRNLSCNSTRNKFC